MVYLSNLERIPSPYGDPYTRRERREQQNRDHNHAGLTAKDRARRNARKQHPRNQH